MSKISKLSVVKAPTVEEAISQETIAILEEALEKARAGDIIQVVIIAKRQEGWHEYASPTESIMEWIGRLEVLKTNWIAKYNELTLGDSEDN